MLRNMSASPIGEQRHVAHKWRLCSHLRQAMPSTTGVPRLKHCNRLPKKIKIARTSRSLSFVSSAWKFSGDSGAARQRDTLKSTIDGLLKCQ